MKSYMAKTEEVKREWYIIDATGLVLGRLASQVASILRGKNKPTFTPNVDTGDCVIVTNTDKVVLTGKKLEKKFYVYHTAFIGGLKQTQYSKLMAEKSDFAVYKAIKGMLPKTHIGNEMIKKLYCYKNAEHNHEAQQPKELILK